MNLNKCKKKYVIFAFSAFLLVSTFSSIVSVSKAKETEIITYYFSEPNITTTNKNTIVNTKDCYIGITGLPSYPASIALPLDKKVDSVVVSYNLKQQTPFTKPILIPTYQPTSEEKVASNIGESKPYSIGYSKGYPILSISLQPVQQQNNQLLYYDSATVTITYSETKTSINKYYRNSLDDYQSVQLMVDNTLPPASFQPTGFNETYSGGLCTSGHYDFVIITTNPLNDTTGELYNWTSLINYRYQNNGLRGIKVTVESIDNCSGYWNSTALFNDSPAHIREFCKDAYQDWGISYVIIGGNWYIWDVNQQIVPYRMMIDRWVRDDGYSEYDIPCDMYYSNLDTNWSYYNGSYGWIWGGGQNGNNDKYSELNIGRFLVWNASQISNQIYKIIQYESNTNKSWLNSTGFFGADLGWTITSKDYLEALRLGNNGYPEFVGFAEWNTSHPTFPLDTSERVYDADVGSDYTSASLYAANHNNASVYIYEGHGSVADIFGWGASTIRSQTNTLPYFGYSMGCHSGRYSHGTCGAYIMTAENMTYRASNIVANTGYGWGETTSVLGGGIYLSQSFFDYFFNVSNNSRNDWQFGKALSYSRDKLGAVMDSESHYSFCSNWYVSHLFGDPMTTYLIQEDEQLIYFLTQSNFYDGMNINSSRPTFYWIKVDSAVQYQLQISLNSSFTTLIQNISNINSIVYPIYYSENGYNISFLLPIENAIPSYNKYYCRVRALYEAR